MERTKEELTNRLVAEIQVLPADKVASVLDFVGYLKSQYTALRADRGSVQAIVRVLEEVGPLHFERGELNSLLSDIDRMRELDLDQHG